MASRWPTAGRATPGRKAVTSFGRRLRRLCEAAPTACPPAPSGTAPRNAGLMMAARNRDPAGPASLGGHRVLFGRSEPRGILPPVLPGLTRGGLMSVGCELILRWAATPEQQR